MNQIILSGIQITISIWEMWMCYEILYMTVLDKKYADKKETIIRWVNIFVVGSLLGINRLIAFFFQNNAWACSYFNYHVYVWDKEKKSSVKCRNSIRLF